MPLAPLTRATIPNDSVGRPSSEHTQDGRINRQIPVFIFISKLLAELHSNLMSGSFLVEDAFELHLFNHPLRDILCGCHRCQTQISQYFLYLGRSQNSYILRGGPLLAGGPTKFWPRP